MNSQRKIAIASILSVILLTILSAFVAPTTCHYRNHEMPPGSVSIDGKSFKLLEPAAPLIRQKDFRKTYGVNSLPVITRSDFTSR
ncbi:MAG: hypothetical protein EXS30_07540 [Pedosphaera sp.]|nr:hypothetical protein [Pedosphaera sp.]